MFENHIIIVSFYLMSVSILYFITLCTCSITFCDELSNYMEKLSCASGIIVMAGDFNVDWLNKDGHERKQLFTIFETFRFIQNIEVATSKHLHLLDYIITRKDCDYRSNFRVSDLSLITERYISLCAACDPTPPVNVFK